MYNCEVRDHNQDHDGRFCKHEGHKIRVFVAGDFLRTEVGITGELEIVGGATDSWVLKSGMPAGLALMWPRTMGLDDLIKESATTRMWCITCDVSVEQG